MCVTCKGHKGKPAPTEKHANIQVIDIYFLLYEMYRLCTKAMLQNTFNPAQVIITTDENFY